MSFDQAIREFADALHTAAPGFALVFLRVAAMMVYAPLIGSERIPKLVKVLIAAVLSLGIASGIPMPRVQPTTIWGVAMGAGGEICFGLAMGLILSFTFIATEWAGEMIGQQMGLNMSEVLDPQTGQQGSLIGDLYFWLTLVIFLAVGGYRSMLLGVRESFDTLPLLSVGINRPLFDLMVGLFSTASTLAIRLAGPMLVTMLIVDLSMGCISKTMPQLNIMSAGLGVRSIVGMLVLIVGVGLTANVLEDSVTSLMQTVRVQYSALPTAPNAPN